MLSQEKSVIVPKRAYVIGKEPNLCRIDYTPQPIKSDQRFFSSMQSLHAQWKHPKTYIHTLWAKKNAKCIFQSYLITYEDVGDGYMRLSMP